MAASDRQEAMRASLTRKISMFKKVFATADGEKLLQFLEDEFDKDNIFVDGDPHKTSYNLGRRDVVIYIKQMLRAKDDE